MAEKRIEETKSLSEGIEVTGDVLLHNGFMAEGMVSLVEATIRRNLECNQGLFINKGKVALNAERLNVGGYGYRPWRPLWISIVFILLGTVIFQLGHKQMIILPTKLLTFVAGVGEGPPDAVAVSEGYPKFSPLVYSLDKFVPLVDLGQAAYWMQSTRPVGRLYEANKVSTPVGARLLRLYMWVHILAGWILTPLVPLGLRGLVKR